MGHLVGAVSIDDLVLVAQNVRARADVASVVEFHAVGRVERRGRGLASLSRFRDGVDHLFVAVLVGSGVRRAGINATGGLIDSRSCVVEPLPPAGVGRPVGGRPRTDSAGSSESLNLRAELGQLQSGTASPSSRTNSTSSLNSTCGTVRAEATINGGLKPPAASTQPACQRRP